MPVQKKSLITYRLAQLRDLDDLTLIEAASFPGNDMSKRQIRRHILNPLAQFWVGIDPARNRVVGYSLVLHHLRRGPRLYSIAVASAYRGHGIGKTLLKKSVAATRASGATKLILEVSSNSRKARTLYADLGFNVWKKAPDYYGGGADAVKMVKTL